MKKFRKNLARKILCGLLAAGVVGVGGSALAADPIIISDSDLTVSDALVNANYVLAGTVRNGTITFDGGGTVSLDSSENLIRDDEGEPLPAFMATDNGIINFGTKDKQLGKLIVKASEDANFIGWIDSLGSEGNPGGGEININAKSYEQYGSGHGIYVKGKDTANGTRLNINVDEFKSETKYTAIHVREGSNAVATINAKKFTAISTVEDTGVAVLQANEGGKITVNAETVDLKGSHMLGGGVIGSGSYGTVEINADKVKIDGNINGAYGGKVETDKTAEFIINTKTLDMNGDINIGTVGHDLNGAVSNNTRNTEVTIKASDAAVITGDINITGNAGTNSNEKDKSTLNIEFNGDSQIKGDINVTGSEKTKNATVNLGGTGDMTASKGVLNVGNSGNVNFIGGKWAVKEWKGDGTGDAAIGEKATVNIEANAMKTETLAVNGKANLIGGNAKVKTKNLSGDNGTVTTDSLDNSISAGSSTAKGLTVQGTGDIADAIQRDASNAQKLADIVSTGEGEAKKSVASEVKTAEGKVGGAYYAKVDENGNINKASEVHAENTTNRAITDMASISIMTWRAENNDMNKRLGELRDSKGEHGAWARMARGESKYGAQNVKNQYNYYQVGYDEKLSVDPNWTVGVALTRTEGNSTFTNGSGENKHTGFAVYGSYLADNGSFIDLIAKYARMDNDYKTVTGAGSGDYETNGYSLSAEYGKRFTKDKGFWIEPQVELTYGKISSADYLTANKVQVSQGDTNSIVGRLGFSLGKDIKQGNVYLRASYLYDFDGETDVKMVDTVSGTPASYKQDLGGGWWEVGVGTNINLSDATHLYFDVEKTYGGNVATPWQWNAGVRWSF